jgi:hypothetical protein
MKGGKSVGTPAIDAPPPATIPPDSTVSGGWGKTSGSGTAVIELVVMISVPIAESVSSPCEMLGCGDVSEDASAPLSAADESAEGTGRAV